MQGMVGSGRASVSAVADLSRAMVNDVGGAAPQAVQAFASLGSWGANQHNQERDLHRWVHQLYGLAVETFEATIQCQAILALEKKTIAPVAIVQFLPDFSL